MLPLNSSGPVEFNRRAFVVHEEKTPGRSEPGQRFVAACVKREQIAASIAKLPELLAA